MTETARHPLQDFTDEVYTACALLTGSKMMCDALTQLDTNETISYELGLVLEKVRDGLMDTIERMSNAQLEVRHD